MTFSKKFKTWFKDSEIEKLIKLSISIILFIIITVNYFINIKIAISLILLLAIFSLLYQIIAPKYPLTSYKIFTYTFSIIMLLAVLILLENESQIKKYCTIFSTTKSTNSYNVIELNKYKDRYKEMSKMTLSTKDIND